MRRAERSGGLRRGWFTGSPRDGRLRRIALVVPLSTLALAVVGMTIACRHLLVAACEGREPAAGPVSLWIVGAGFLLAAGAVVVMQAARVANRVAGPEQRLIRAMQRMRGGDLSFRVHLRKGDLLTGLALECNQLLDWLNENPPSGTRTGTDLIEVHPEEHHAEVAHGEPLPEELVDADGCARATPSLRTAFAEVRP